MPYGHPRHVEVQLGKPPSFHQVIALDPFTRRSLPSGRYGGTEVVLPAGLLVGFAAHRGNYPIKRALSILRPIVPIHSDSTLHIPPPKNCRKTAWVPQWRRRPSGTLLWAKRGFGRSGLDGSADKMLSRALKVSGLIPELGLPSPAQDVAAGARAWISNGFQLLLNRPSASLCRSLCNRNMFSIWAYTAVLFWDPCEPANDMCVPGRRNWTDVEVEGHCNWEGFVRSFE